MLVAQVPILDRLGVVVAIAHWLERLRARRLHRAIGALGWMPALVGDPETLDYRTAAVHARMREDMRAVAEAAAAGRDAEKVFGDMLRRYLGAQRGGLL